MPRKIKARVQHQAINCEVGTSHLKHQIPMPMCQRQLEKQLCGIRPATTTLIYAQ
jgi:hypothetical protein